MEKKPAKRCVIYYSLDGNTRFIAEKIAQAVGADLLELKTEKGLPSGGIRYFVGGMQAVLGLKPALRPLDKNPGDYDVLFCGTPTWARRYVPAWHTFLSRFDLRGKKMALFCCNQGDIGQTLTAMKKHLAGNDLLGEIEFLEPLKNKPDEAAQKAQTWAQEIVARIG